jgi:hypothetical protein
MRPRPIRFTRTPILAEVTKIATLIDFPSSERLPRLRTRSLVVLPFALALED